MEPDAHTTLSSDARERAALYLVGGLDEEERERFEAHLGGCRICREEVARLAPVADELVLAAPEAEPPLGLKERLLARVRARGFTLLPAAERAWIGSDVPGVEISQLWVDRTRERHTVLIRMAAGSSLPAHRHGGPEECYVVEGDLRDGELVLASGDYVRHDAGTAHAVTTREGCLLLVTQSLRDQRVEP